MKDLHNPPRAEFLMFQRSENLSDDERTISAYFKTTLLVKFVRSNKKSGNDQQRPKF